MNDIPLTHLVDISGLSPAWRGVLLREYAVNGAENIVLSHNHFNALCAAENPAELLAEYKGDGYVLADLRNPDTPTIYPVKAGTEFEVRCYTVSVTETEEKELDITVLGSIPTDG